MPGQVRPSSSSGPPRRGGRLAALFAGPATLTAEQRRSIETEEAWILGVENAP